MDASAFLAGVAALGEGMAGLCLHAKSSAAVIYYRSPGHDREALRADAHHVAHDLGEAFVAYEQNRKARGLTP